MTDNNPAEGEPLPRESVERLLSLADLVLRAQRPSTVPFAEPATDPALTKEED